MDTLVPFKSVAGFAFLVNLKCGGVLTDIVILTCTVSEYVVPAVRPTRISSALSVSGIVQ